MTQKKPLNDDFYKALNLAGKQNAYEMLLYAPESYVDFRQTVDTERSIPVLKKVVINVIVEKKLTKIQSCDTVKQRRWYADLFTPKPIYIMQVRSKERVFTLTMVTREMFTDYRVGAEIYIGGTIIIDKGDLFIHNPETADERWMGKVMPVYPHLKGVVNGRRKIVLRKDEVRTAISYMAKLNKFKTKLIESITAQLGQYSLPEEFMLDLLYSLHLPGDIDDVKSIQEWIDDLGIRKLLSAENRVRGDVPKSSIQLDGLIIKNTVAEVPFTMSDSQIKAIVDTLRDLRSLKPLRRIASGDVGSGKSIVQFVLAAIVQKCGYRVAIMTPNGILAKQLIREFQATYPTIPVLYLGSGAAPKTVPEDNPVLIGTTSVIHFVVKHDYQLDLISIDEQQKVGVDQKEAVLAEHTNLLECTATPIPKSMALTLFADTAVSQIYPHTQKQIKSAVVGPDQRQQMFSLIKQQVGAGHKVCIVFAKIEPKPLEDNDEEADQTRKALRHARELWEKHFPGQVVELHGGLKEKEKEQAFNRLLNDEAKIVLATTILEIGANIPNLRVMVVHDPDMYGASQLHQLRGRLVRAGEGVAHFMMYLDRTISRKAKLRLETVCSTLDGFELAHKDLEQRGFGDVVGGGTRQHGKTYGLFINRDISPKSLVPYLNALSQTGSFQAALDRERPVFSLPE